MKFRRERASAELMLEKKRERKEAITFRLSQQLAMRCFATIPQYDMILHNC